MGIILYLDSTNTALSGQPPEGAGHFECLDRSALLFGEVTHRL